MLNIVLYGDPILQRPAAPVTVFDKALKELASDMYSLMQEKRGVGISAPQVGKGIRLSIVDLDVKGLPILMMVNPYVTFQDGQQMHGEGCLSLPGIDVPVLRRTHVVVRYQDLDGKSLKVDATSLLARCIQHEIDHLDGKLIINHLAPEARRLVLERWQGARLPAEKVG